MCEWKKERAELDNVWQWQSDRGAEDKFTTSRDHAENWMILLNEVKTVPVNSSIRFWNGIIKEIYCSRFFIQMLIKNVNRSSCMYLYARSFTYCCHLKHAGDQKMSISLLLCVAMSLLYWGRRWSILNYEKFPDRRFYTNVEIFLATSLKIK